MKLAPLFSGQLTHEFPFLSKEFGVRVRAAPILYCCHDFTPPQYPVHTPDCGQIFFFLFYQKKISDLDVYQYVRSKYYMFQCSVFENALVIALKPVSCIRHLFTRSENNKPACNKPKKFHLLVSKKNYMTHIRSYAESRPKWNLIGSLKTRVLWLLHDGSFYF